MTKELREQMDALRQIGPKLNQASEDAARIIAEVESFLNGLHLGISGQGKCYKNHSYLAPSDDDDPKGMGARRKVYSTLTYDRPESGGEFAIFIRREVTAAEINSYTNGWDFETIDLIEAPWNRCSRSERLAAFETLPSLLKAIFDNATASAAKAEKATETIRETMTTLGIEPTAHAAPEAKPVRKPRS